MNTEKQKSAAQQIKAQIIQYADAKVGINNQHTLQSLRVKETNNPLNKQNHKIPFFKAPKNTSVLFSLQKSCCAPKWNSGRRV